MGIQLNIAIRPSIRLLLEIFCESDALFISADRKQIFPDGVIDLIPVIIIIRLDAVWWCQHHSR